MNTGRIHNPFSSHLVEPACGGYIFNDTSPYSSLQGVMDHLAKHSYRGHLVGTHGAGKSTLLTDIGNYLTARGRRVTRWQSNNRNPYIPHNWWEQVTRHDVILLDGAERLYPGLLMLVRLVTRLRRRGLVITTHAPINLGASIAVNPNPAALATKINGLRKGKSALDLGTTPTADEVEQIAQHLREHNGSGREVLFDLYIRHEADYAKTSSRP